MTTKEVVIVDVEQYDRGFPPSGLIEFQAWLAKQVAKIPAEFVPAAVIEIESVGSYESSSYANVKIAYDRPETAEEIAERERELTRRAAQQVQKELAEYERLKAKFNTTGA